MNSLVRALAVATFAFAAGCSSADAASDPATASTDTTPTQNTTGATVDVSMTSGATTTTETGTPAGIRGHGGKVRTLGHGVAPAAPPGAGTVITPPPPTTTPPTTTPMPFRGVNLAGGEFGSAIPGTDGVDYQFPNNAEIDYFVSKGMNTFRIGFRWERLQPTAYGSFVNAYVSQLDALVAYATSTSANANVILNPHNFARYYGNTVGSTQVPNAVFADLWSKLATRFKGNPRVMFNLVNEPNSMPTEQWASAANAAIAAIRAAGAPNTIIVPGNAWTGAFSWYSTDYGTANAVAMLTITDPSNNTIFEVHQYLDGNAAGEAPDCVNGTIGRTRLAPFVKWLRDNGKKGFVGEFAGGDNATCNAAVSDMLTYMMSASDVLVGWLWWAAGPYWGDYIFTIEPKGTSDRPQMALLQPFLF